MFTKAFLCGAFVACVAAQSKVLFFTHVPNPITDGQPAAITYSTNDTQTPVTIILRQGQTDNLQTIMTLTDNSYNSQYIWTPPESLPNGYDYALQIKQGTQVNYFGPFAIQGANPAAVSSAASNATMTTSTTTATRNSTASMGTGTTMHRNTTMSSPSLTKPTTKATGKTTTTNTVASTSGAGFQGTQTGSGSGPSNTGGAAALDLNAGSSFALAVGAVAAVFYLA